MMDLAALRTFDTGELSQTYGPRECILYALGVGLGLSPLDPHELAYVYGPQLRVLPTMASVLATAGEWMRTRPELGIRWEHALHGSEHIVVHRPLGMSDRLLGRTRVTGIADKGPGKGAVLALSKTLLAAEDGAPVATCHRQLYLRGHGGFATADDPGDRIEPVGPERPATDPDGRLEIATRADQALLHRLFGDLNPLHADPAFARAAGYPRPILHGLSTLGTACHVLIQRFCGDDPTRVRELAARFAGPAFPGERLQLQCWSTGRAEVAFEATSAERDTPVLRRGVLRWV
jgi:acyl dehydratase